MSLWYVTISRLRRFFR